MANRSKLEKILDPEVAKEFIDEGYTVDDLAHEFWVSRAVVLKYLEIHGLEAGSKPTLKKSLPVEVAERRLNAGETYETIAKELGFSKISVQNYCNKNGLHQVYRYLKNGQAQKLRDHARDPGEKTKFRSELLDRIVQLLEKAYSWDEIEREVGHSKGYCSNLASQHGVYSMYVRMRGKLYQVRSHPRAQQRFSENICLGDISEAKKAIA